MRFNDNKHLGLGDVRLTLWEQEQIEKEFAELEARLATAEAEVVRLRGQVAALKGRVPDLPVVFRRGDPLPRFGIRWSSPTEPICVPMDDGYWTVWHYADAALAEIVRERNDYRSSFAKSRDDELSVAQEIDELRAKLADLEAKVEKAPCSDFCRDAKEKHHIPYTEHHHACWKVEALGLEGQDYMRRTEAK